MKHDFQHPSILNISAFINLLDTQDTHIHSVDRKQ